MKLADLGKVLDEPGSAERYAEEDAYGRLIDGRLLFNQKETAMLLGITARAFSDWNVQPMRRVKREAFYYWPDVFEERNRRQLAARGTR